MAEGQTGGQAPDTSKILRVYLELAADQKLVDEFRGDPAAYDKFLRDRGLGDAEIAYMQSSRGAPASVMLTVWPNPPTVWTPPTVWQ